MFRIWIWIKNWMVVLDFVFVSQETRKYRKKKWHCSQHFDLNPTRPRGPFNLRITFSSADRTIQNFFLANDYLGQWRGRFQKRDNRTNRTLGDCSVSYYWCWGLCDVSSTNYSCLLQMYKRKKGKNFANFSNVQKQFGGSSRRQKDSNL